MKKLVASVYLLSLAGCGKSPLAYGDPPNSVMASKCGVSENELLKAKETASHQHPYSTRDIGKCNLIVDNTRYVSVITPEIQRSVAAMMAREAAEEKK